MRIFSSKENLSSKSKDNPTAPNCGNHRGNQGRLFYNFFMNLIIRQKKYHTFPRYLQRLGNIWYLSISKAYTGSLTLWILCELWILFILSHLASIQTQRVKEASNWEMNCLTGKIRTGQLGQKGKYHEKKEIRLYIKCKGY